MSSIIVVSCPNCGKQLGLPGDRGKIFVTCPICKHQFTHGGKGTGHTNTNKSKESSSYSSKSNNSNPSYGAYGNSGRSYNPPPPNQQTPTRTITIDRFMHAHKQLNGVGIRNIISDAKPVAIYLDGVKQGTLSKDQPFVLKIDSREHTISYSPISTKYKLPAGKDNYVAAYFNNAFMIGMVNDVFRDKLTDFVLNMVRGQGFADRIKDPNNAYHAVEITINSDYIGISWRLNKTSGLREWATGEKSEKIYYNQIGLTPTPINRQPDGYWSYLNTYVRDSVESDSVADLEHVTGGFAFRKTHGLY